MGPGEAATPDQNELAYELGKAIAHEGWVVLTGGRAFGVMDAALKGARQHGGLTIGILPHDARGSSSYADIKIITGMGGIRSWICAACISAAIFEKNRYAADPATQPERCGRVAHYQTDGTGGIWCID